MGVSHQVALAVQKHDSLADYGTCSVHRVLETGYIASKVSPVSVILGNEALNASQLRRVPVSLKALGLLSCHHPGGQPNQDQCNDQGESESQGEPELQAGKQTGDEAGHLTHIPGEGLSEEWVSR